jgi:hypothetical protein
MFVTVSHLPLFVDKAIKKSAWAEVANTLAYFSTELIIVVKSFIVQAPVGSILPE